MMHTTLLLAATWITGVAIGLAASGATPPFQASGASDSLSRALEDLNSGRVFEAVQGLMEIVQNDATAGAADFYLSVIYTSLGQLPMARDFAERALESDPDEGKFHYQLGLVLHRSDERVAARSALQHALRLGMGGDEAAAWRELGDVNVLLLEREAAGDAYQKAAEIEPANARNRLALGQFLLDRNESEAALAHLRAAVVLDPTLDGAHAGLGIALRRVGDTEAAIETLRRGVELNPADQRSRYALAQSLTQAGHEEEARDVLEEYRLLEARISGANTALDDGTRHLQDGNLVEARRLLEEAVVLAPNYSAGHETLGKALLAVGEVEGAVMSLERAVFLNPLNSAAYSSLGAALYEAGQFEAALEATRRSVVLDSGNPKNHRQLGKVLLELNRESEARTAFETAAGLELVHQ